MSSRSLMAGVLGAVLLTAGCAKFADQPPPESWQPQEQLTPQGGPEPQVPGEGQPEAGPGGGEEPTEIPPPDGCTDYNPSVIGTCLDTVVAVAALPGAGGDPTALVGERRSGRIMRVKAGTEPELVTTVPVDGSTDGGLTGLVLSPTYAEDQLIFAYVTTASDNRVVRIAPGNPTQNSLVMASGLRAPGGVCTTVNGPGAWVTDRAGTQDVLYKLEVGKQLSSPAWTWPDRPGVAGCASTITGVLVVMSTAGNAQRLPLASDGSFSGKPEVTMDKEEGFGLLGGLSAVNDQIAVAGTVNKDGGQPVSSDDRAFVLSMGGGGGGGGPD